MSKKLTKRAAARQSATVVETPTPELAPTDFLNSPAAKRWLPILGLALLTFVFMLPVLQGVYIWDDDQWLTHNPLIINGGDLYAIWFQPNASPHYYPLVFTSYWLEYKIWGLGVIGPDHILRGVGYHAVNLALHAASAIIIFLTLKRLKLPGGTLGAWLAAAVFAIHPVNVESVAWIAERKNCLSGLFFFASIFAALKFFHVYAQPDPVTSTDHPPYRWRWYVLAMIFFLAAMLSKTTACVLGPVFLLMIWWRRGRISLKEFALTLPFIIIAVAMGAFTAILEIHHVGSIGPEWKFSLLQRILIAGTDLWFYIGKLFVPYPVVQIYPRFDIVAGQPVTNPFYYLAPVAYVALVLVLFFLRKKISRGPITAVLFFAGVLAPALGFLNFYTMIFTFVADHYQYFACIGIIVLAVETILLLLRKASTYVNAASDPDAPQRFRRLTTSLVTGGILLSLGVLTRGISELYYEGVSLWGFNVDHNPKGFGPWGAYAQAWLNHSPPDRNKALDALNHAIECAPDDWRAYHQTGMIYLDLNMPEKGLEYLSKAESLMPDFVRNKRADLFSHRAAASVQPEFQAGRALVTYGPHFLVAKHLQSKEQWDQAINEYLIDIKEYPGDLQAYVNIGQCYMGKEDYATAVAWFRKAIDRHPNFAEAWLDLGLSLRQLNREQEAMEALLKAKALDDNILLRNPEILRAASEHLRNLPQHP